MSTLSLLFRAKLSFKMSEFIHHLSQPGEKNAVRHTGIEPLGFALSLSPAVTTAVTS